MTTSRLSFEFFPPRNAQQARRFWYTLGSLQTLDPEFVSVTWGALGSDSDASIDILRSLSQDSNVPIAAHMTCAGQSEGDCNAMLDRLTTIGIKRLVALRGDLSPGSESAQSNPDNLTHASELVALAARRNQFTISVAAYPESHPESPSREEDLRWLKHKFDQGADNAITQFFFEADTFLRYRDAAAKFGLGDKIIPGILPIHNIDKVVAFSERCQANVPSSLIERFQTARTDDSRLQLAIDQCVALCRELESEGVNEFHLYTLNQATLSLAIGSELLGRPLPAMVAA